LVGHRGRYDRAIRELQRRLLVTSAGVREQRSGRPAVVLELTCQRFDVGATVQRYATTRFFDTMIERLQRNWRGSTSGRRRPPAQRSTIN
jgi:hypothetical protein